jgi:hypothetical protein
MRVIALAAQLHPPPTLLDPLWEDTRRRLAPLGVADRPIASDLAESSGLTGKLSLRAACWGIGNGEFHNGECRSGEFHNGERRIGECRIVRIEGPNAEIVNTMIFPDRPESLPVFAAELLVFGGVPRLAFVDLQVPGMAGGRRDEVAARTRGQAVGFAHLPCDQTAPDWAVHWSTGGYVFTRPNDTAFAGDLLLLYGRYLDLWVDLAADACGRSGGDGRPDPAAAAELEHYKRSHVRHSPGTAFLTKLFGAEWTGRFLNGFLYR